MPRTIYLVVYNSRLFPAHWSLWIPSTSNPNIGTRVHAQGDVATGFEICFERNYDIGQTSRKHEILPLADVDSAHVVDTPGDGSRSVDQEPRDKLETIALRIPAPGPSLLPFQSRTSGAKVEIKNCQTWLINVIREFHKEGIVDDNALRVIMSAPQH
ncbi:hypothetical protein F5B19DRAFT_154075 [Rostrohypoxylon terebratum]|nr:hypothetical protein F5B19DRAFT_154075 [Rostrohypoxylon terebratum]